MPVSWSVILQKQAGHSLPDATNCQKYVVNGLPRPCRILIVSCDAASSTNAAACYRALQSEFARRAPAPDICTGPIYPNCISENEPACVHVLVPLIAQAPLNAQSSSLFDSWLARFGAKAIVMPALAPGVSHQQVFGSASQNISQLQLAPWGGDPARLASLVLRRALCGERPGLFISYRRHEAAAVADQIFDAMSHRGFRVFLDRFSGTTGRLFPQEIAEEMADKDVVLVLATPQIAQSRWTLWEIAFARLYRLGLLALQWPNCPQIPGIQDHHTVCPTTNSTLEDADLKQAADFIERGHTLAALTRRAFYETLVEAAALSKQGTVKPVGDGVLDVANSNKASVATVLAAGRPGRLADVHKLVDANSRSTAPHILLAGQHRHLPLHAQDDLKWLAAKMRIVLSGRAEVYRDIRARL